MERKKLKYINGKYIVDIDISVNEWKEMLLNDKIFFGNSKQMILRWYYQEDYQATSKTIHNIYSSNLKSTPYNGVVIGLSKRILKYIDNRFLIESAENENSLSYWCIPFEGWHVDFDSNKNFVWKIRDELVIAIEETPKFTEGFKNEYLHENNMYESYVTKKEGKKCVKNTVIYERNSQNRRKAIELNKNKYGKVLCEVCGFDFEKTYGERGKDFIEVHHNKPLYLVDEQINVNPKKDLSCLCSNCHRVIHRNKSDLLSIKKLREIVKERML